MKRCRPMRLNSPSNRVDHFLTVAAHTPSLQDMVVGEHEAPAALLVVLLPATPAPWCGHQVSSSCSSSWLCLLCNCKRLDLGSQCICLNLQCAAGRVRAAAAFCPPDCSHNSSCCGILIAGDVRSQSDSGRLCLACTGPECHVLSTSSFTRYSSCMLRPKSTITCCTLSKSCSSSKVASRIAVSAAAPAGMPSAALCLGGQPCLAHKLLCRCQLAAQALSHPQQGCSLLLQPLLPLHSYSAWEGGGAWASRVTPGYS